jgi:DNA-binding SARP family transcriptional activator
MIAPAPLQSRARPARHHIGRPQRKIPKKGKAPLAYRALQQGELVTREKLADLLWPYQNSEQARYSLRNCLLKPRKTLG